MKRGGGGGLPVVLLVIVSVVCYAAVVCVFERESYLPHRSSTPSEFFSGICIITASESDLSADLSDFSD